MASSATSTRRQQDRLFTSAERGRPEVGHETWHQADVRVGAQAYKLRVSRSRPARYRVELAETEHSNEHGRAVEVDVERSGRFEFALVAGGQRFDVLSVAQGPDFLVEVDGAVHRISGGEAGLVRAPAPAMVVAITVGVGDEVAEGDVVAIVESMKLETALRTPAAGRVAEVLADVNTQVETGAKLVRIEQDPGLPPGGGHPSDARPWLEISVIPWVFIFLRYAMFIDNGSAGEPEDVVLKDRVIMVIGAVWLAVFATGVVLVGARG